jgi:antitoxin component of RelBE/YafQ-DinJ toxin-antitoxin module
MKDENSRTLINLRVDAEVREDFKLAVKLLGYKGMSQALHHFIVRTINEQREKYPQKFVRNVDDESVGTTSIPIIDAPRASEKRAKVARKKK